MKKNVGLIILVVACVIAIPTFIFLSVDKWQQTVEKKSGETSGKVEQSNDKTNKQPEEKLESTDRSNQDSDNTTREPVNKSKRDVNNNVETENVDANQQDEDKSKDADQRTVNLIHSKVEDELANLRSTCERKLNALYSSYKSTTDKSQQNRYISDGFRELGNCDQSFNQIMVNYTSEMMELGIDPKSNVANYRSNYETIKNNKILELDSNR